MQPVVIIGGGPVGLTAALCLAQQNIKSVLIEKHAHTTDHPKARGVNGRSMEIFRSLGMTESLMKYSMPHEAYRMTWLQDLKHEELIHVPATEDYSKHSPTKSSVIAQDDVEKELFRMAQKSPLIDLRFNTEMTHIIENDEKVLIEVIDKQTGQKKRLSSEYLIAADGANSPVRKHLNIPMEGKDNLGTFCNMYCEMDLDKYVAKDVSVGYFLTRPDIRGTFLLAKKGLRKWLIGVRIDSNPNLSIESFTDEFCLEHVKKIIQDESVKVRLINKGFWTMAALTAKTYQVGRIFLAGDSAHRLPPTGGFGMNTGIQDAHNLAWKLAMVIQKKATPKLLETYFNERSQIAKANIEWSTHNFERIIKMITALMQNDLPTFKKAALDQAKHVNNILLDLGFIYGENNSQEKKFKPTAEVGARAPHCWLQHKNQKLSTLDLFKNQFVLLCSDEATHWQKQYAHFPCQVITIGEKGQYQDKNHDFFQKYELSEKGAVLVRPDGHIAWKANDDQQKMPQFSWLLNPS